MSNIYAFATDTVYGLGARCDDSSAIDALYRLKERPDAQPMQVLVTDRAMAEKLVHLEAHQPVDAETRIYPARIDAAIDRRLIADGGIGIRMPNHLILRNYITTLGAAIAASSANRRGESALHTAESVAQVFPGVPIIITGDCPGGRSSQLWDMRTTPPKQLR